MITVKNLYKIYGGKAEEADKLLDAGLSKEQIYKQTQQMVALRDINFSVEKGELFVVLGSRGSGKSTLTRCINRIIEPSKGEIFINGQNIMEMSNNELLQLRRVKIGLVFSEYILFPHLNVLDNVAYILKIQDIPARRREKRAIEVLDSIGMKGKEMSWPNDLTREMQLRVKIAAAMANEAEIILMDEPLSNLDHGTRLSMQDELLRLQMQQGKTIVLTTDKLDEALKLGSRIAILDEGIINLVGTPDEVIEYQMNRTNEKPVTDEERNEQILVSEIMEKTEVVHFPKDGPRYALYLMKNSGMSAVLVVDQKNRLKGVLYADKAAEAIKKGTERWGNIIDVKIDTVTPDTPLQEIVSRMKLTPTPLAVVDEDGVFMGTVNWGAIYAALAGGEQI